MFATRKLIVLVAILAIPLASFKIAEDAGLKNEKLVGASGTIYLLLYQGNFLMDFVTERPDKRNENIQLCIAGAFTRLEDDKIDGLYISNGKTGNRGQINKTLGGGISIINGKAEIFPTEKGALLNDSLLSAIAVVNGSFFQQIQCVVNGKAASFKDIKNFQRRGIVIFKNGKTAIVESDRAITLKTFSEDLAGLNAREVLYTDMGNWDEGWYRDGQGKVITIGHSRAQTNRQSNWVILKRK